MKRIVSTFLLIIMSFVSIQTTWDWHYCGDILRSVTLADGNSACCCSNGNETEKNDSSDLPQVNKLCCSDYLIDVATDNFDLSHFVIGTVQHVSKSFFLCAYPLKFYEQRAFSVSQYVFPPGRSVEYSADLLTLICIFRI
jgi:hypothetical protein